MVARGRWRTRLAAGGAGLAINAGLLALLTLERRAPAMVEPPTVVITLEPRPAEPRPVATQRRRTAPAHRLGAPSPVLPWPRTPSSNLDPLPLPASTTGPNPSQTVKPGWRVGHGEYVDPVTAHRAREAWEKAENRRYKRACLGQSSEHMTEEEAFACWDSWSDTPIAAWAQRPGRPWPGSPGDPTKLKPRKGSLQKIKPQRINPKGVTPGTGTPPG